MLQRISEGRSPFAADKNHIHHRLLALGFEHFEAVFVIYLLQAVLFVCGWYLRYESDLVILGTFALFAAAVLGFLQFAARAGWRWRSLAAQPEASRAATTPARWWMVLRTRLPHWALAVGGLCVVLYALRTAWLAAPVPPDIGWLAAVLAAALTVAGAVSLARPVPAWLLHGALYVGAVAIVFLEITASPRLPALIEKLGLGVLAGCIMISFRLTMQRRFHLTPLDFLVVFVALALPNLPGSVAAPRDLGLGAIKILVLFYAIELLLSHSAKTRFLLHAGGIGILGLVGLRGLL
jgi:UDP-GlcNAc:undecaprenyl-phosphate GlcNAc-1-phosphate transferase